MRENKNIFGLYSQYVMADERSNKTCILSLLGKETLLALSFNLSLQIELYIVMALINLTPCVWLTVGVHDTTHSHDRRGVGIKANQQDGVYKNNTKVWVLENLRIHHIVCLNKS